MCTCIAYMYMYMYAFRSSRGLCPGRGELRLRYMCMFIIIVYIMCSTILLGFCPWASALNFLPSLSGLICTYCTIYMYIDIYIIFVGRGQTFPAS